MYPHPLFRRLLAHSAAGELRDVRKLTFAALCIALCIALAAMPSVPLWGGAKITWGFLARSVCAWVCGPVLGTGVCLAEDLLSFFLTGGGGYPFFPGYTLTTMLGVFVYSLFFYKSKITVRRVFLAKLLTNIENVTLGALWMALLSGKAWYVTAAGSAVKNLICLPFQTLLLMTLFAALRPVLVKMRGLSEKETRSFRRYVRPGFGRGAFRMKTGGKAGKFIICFPFVHKLFTCPH